MFKTTTMKPQNFWCSVCDLNIVDSEKPETGDFYEIHGHQRGTENEIGDYHSVLFAICPDCKLEDAVKKVQITKLHVRIQGRPYK